MSVEGKTESDVLLTADSKLVIPPRRTRLQSILRALKTAPLTAWFGLIVVGLYLFIAILAPLLARRHPALPPAPGGFDERGGPGFRRSGAPPGGKARLDHGARDPPHHPAAADRGVRPEILLRLPDNRRTLVPWPWHPAADRRLGLDGPRQCDAGELWRHHAPAAGRGHCASDRRRQFPRRLVPAQGERAEGMTGIGDLLL